MEIANEQAGFGQGWGTRDQIMNLRILMHKAVSPNNHSICALWTSRRRSTISHDKLWVTMMDMEYHLHLIDLLVKLYRKQLAKIKVAGTLLEWFSVKKGVRQGCVLSLYLFNILVEIVMKETLDGFQGGLQIGGRMVTNLWYADDIIVLTTLEAELQKLVDCLDQVNCPYSLLINVDKEKASDGIACRNSFRMNWSMQIRSRTLDP